MSNEINIKLNKGQSNFFSSNVRTTGLCGGYGGGKSFVGVLKTVIKHKELKGVPVAYYLPSYPLIRDIAFPKFRELLETMGIGYKLNESHKEFKTDFGKIILRSMDNPALIVGYETGYSLVDECDILANLKMNLAYRNILARNRAKLPEGFINQLDFVGTPEGYGFFYNLFKEKQPNKQLFTTSTLDNEKNLPSGYIEGLKEEYDERLLEAYLHGRFVNLNTDSVYSLFDRDLNVFDGEIQKTNSVLIGLDFNVGNMNAVVALYDGIQLDVINIIKGSLNIFSIIKEIKHRYANHTIAIYPDASGGNRTTNSTSTNFDYLRQAGFKVVKRTKNPDVKDRVNVVNNLLGKQKVRIHSSCLPLIEALEQQAYKKGIPDKDSGLDHVLEAFGYLCYGIFPPKKRMRFVNNSYA
jgi:phage terminase large subunit